MAAIMRAKNWPGKLNDFIESRRSAPFQWGTNDCALFVADAVLGITGVDYAHSFRGRYTTAVGSARILVADGYRNAIDVVTDKLGMPVPRAFVGRGDVALFDGADGETLGVCVGQFIVGPGSTGLNWIPMDLCKYGWRV